MAKTARRSVTSNPSTLTKSASYSGNYSAASNSNVVNDSFHQKTSSSSSSLSSTINNSSGGSSINSSLPPVTLDPLRATGHHQFTARTISNNYSSRHDSRATVRPFKNSSATATTSRSDSENINISNNSTNSTSSQQFNSTTAANRLAAERERIRMEFYATYDVMTGVRIAATLGGFFGLMVFLVVYKSRSHSNETLKVLKDPKMAAVAAACMQEEEDREIQEALEATGLSLYPDEYDDMFFRRQRMFSLGNVSAPPVLHRNFRFSSVGGGGYSSLLEPPRRYSLSSGGRRKSISESSRVLSAYPMGSSFGTDDYFIETDDELDNEFDGMSTREDDSTADKRHRLLEVPIAGQGQESRRSSGMTCCSTESSYLERRCSAVTLGLSSFHNRPPIDDGDVNKRRRSSTDLWDYYYPDIQIINPTPKVSPCPSERNLHEPRLPLPLPSTSLGLNPAILRDSSSSQSVIGWKHGTPSTNIGWSTALYRDSSSMQQNSGQYGWKYLRKASYNNSDSIEEDPAELTDQISICTESRDDIELKQGIRHTSSISGNVTNNNHVQYATATTNSYPGAQYQTPTRNGNGGSIRRAPLASLSSFKISSVDYQDSDLRSLGSDSVFVESYADTDDDMEQFSTDSDEISVSLGNDYPTTKATSEQKKNETDPNKQHYSHKTETSHTIDSNKKPSTTNTSTKRIRPALERHRTISSISNDRIMLISQQSQELPMHEMECYADHRSSSAAAAASAVASATTSLTTPSTNSTVAVIDLQMPTTSFSYDNNNETEADGNRSSDSCMNRLHQIAAAVIATVVDDETKQQHHQSKSKSSYSSNSNCENVEVNVIIENRPTTTTATATTTISPSVILELPVIALSPSQANDGDDDDDDDVDDPPRDPSLPGTSRKWSKETLF